MSWRLWLAIALLSFGCATEGLAHEVRPAFLQIVEGKPGVFAVTWKQPTLGDVAIHLEPRLSNGWLQRTPDDQYAAAGFLIRTWTIRDLSPHPLTGRTLEIVGLKDTLTDVLVRIRLRGGSQTDAVLRPETPSLVLSLGGGSALGMVALVGLGVSHILTGPDHLLFVLGLLLLVKDRWSLLKTISAFTLAHSLTLAAAVFGLIALPSALLNALIALSILVLAVEVVRARQGELTWSARRPWVIAFGFGLLHGLGFAGGLRNLGLEGYALVSALLLFNLGVEVGQAAFIALALALRRAFRLMEIRWSGPAVQAPTYLIGSLGAYWTFHYALALLSSAP